MVEFKYVKVNSLKIGNVINIDDVPCKIVSIDKSKPGKHGAAKARIVGINLFNDKKHTVLSPTDKEMQSPMITRSNAQVVADMGSVVQIMDLTTYETFDAPKPNDKEILAKLVNGAEVEYLRLEEQVKILRVK